ncbi:cell wall-binding repeat-containing protein [Staphylospora marina]|uniref:cell wall-binding repeat-containing protein n=1 Tax=Staphylospora marina TaxID=2490858 RepID=UPI000F5C222F|nr:cell wall-binding repeat-containing protein [Staphylospora marina]
MKKATVLATLGALGFSLLAPMKDTLSADPEPRVKRLDGANRYEVSARISQELTARGFTSDTVVLARGDLFTDALSGGPLASRLKAPMLLTSTGSLPAPIESEVTRRKPSRAIILGGTGSVSEDVADRLKQLGVSQVERLDGPNRFAVSAKVAEEVVAGSHADTAFIASGLVFPDALSASSLAGQNGWPILLTGQDKLPEEVKTFIQTHPTIKKYVIVGGTGTVSDSVKSELMALGKTVTRIGGANRFEVGVNLARTFNMSPESLVFARGDVFADALSGGPLAALTRSPLMLVMPGSLPAPVESYLKESAGRFHEGYILGGTGSVQVDIERKIVSFVMKEELRGVWVDMFHDGAKTPQQVDKLLADVKKMGANAIFLQVRRRGDAFYNNSLEPRTEDPALPAGYDPLQDLITKAHASNPRIQVHAWFATMPIWNKTTPPKSVNHIFNAHGPSKTGRDMWLSLNHAGENVSGSEYVIDPGHPDAVNHTVNVVKHVAQNYAVDGIHLDLIRYMETDWGYNPTAVSRFNSQYGRTGLPNPQDEVWKAWRREQVNNMVQKIYAAVVSVRPNAVVSAATISWGNGPRTIEEYNASRTMNSALQDWNRWLKEGWIDVAIPMNYFREYDADQKVWFENWLNWEKDHQYERNIYPGVGIYMNSISDGITQIRKALRPSPSGNFVQGVVLYSYAVTNKDGVDNQVFYSALTTSSPYDSIQPPVFATPAVPPTLSWKSAPTDGHLTGKWVQTTGVPDHREIKITGPENRTVFTDGSGEFTALNLKPGTYTVQAGSVSKTVTVSAGKVSNVQLSE